MSYVIYRMVMLPNDPRWPSLRTTTLTRKGLDHIMWPTLHF